MGVFDPIQPLAALLFPGQAKALIDNAVFRLHYRVTTAMMFFFCFIVTAHSLIGTPISCIPQESIKENVLNNYCWISSTFTLPGHQKGKVGVNVAYPGVGTYQRGQPEAVYHSYYQWVPFMLFLQGIMFYIPHWLWKSYEEKCMVRITEGMHRAKLGEHKKHMGKLVAYLSESLNFHGSYGTCYVLCEFLNLVNCIGNVFFIDVFLNGAFLEFGLEVVNFSLADQANRTDPMIQVFPRLTKCTFHKYGHSGTIETLETMCVLPHNIFNEKIYVFLWFWLLILSAVTTLNLICRFAQICCPLVRAYAIQRTTRLSYLAGLDALINRLGFGDFVMISLLGRNLDTLVFREVLDDLARVIHLGVTVSGAPVAGGAPSTTKTPNASGAPSATGSPVATKAKI